LQANGWKRGFCRMPKQGEYSTKRLFAFVSVIIFPKIGIINGVSQKKGAL
jgi:hypothetical protein